MALSHGPTPRRALFRHDGSAAADTHLAGLAAHFEPGRPVAAFRALPSAGFLAWFVVPALLLGALALVISPDPLIAVVPLGLGLGTAAIFVVGGWFDRHRVCEHALVLGPRGRQVIPYETIDPGRVHDARGLFLTRQLAIPTMAVHGSTGPMLLLNGLQRPMFSANVAGARTTGPQGSPFGYYTLGTRQHRQLAEALEAAMVADGFVEAHGLAASTFDLRRVRPGFRQDGPPLVHVRALHDPPLGVHAALPTVVEP